MRYRTGMAMAAVVFLAGWAAGAEDLLKFKGEPTGTAICEMTALEQTPEAPEAKPRPRGELVVVTLTAAKNGTKGTATVNLYDRDNKHLLTAKASVQWSEKAGVDVRHDTITFFAPLESHHSVSADGTAKMEIFRVDL